MQQSAAEILEAFGGLIMEGWQVENKGKSRCTRGVVVVSWDVEGVIGVGVDNRGYEGENRGGQRDGSEGVEDVGGGEADELGGVDYLGLDVVRVLGWGEAD